MWKVLEKKHSLCFQIYVEKIYDLPSRFPFHIAQEIEKFLSFGGHKNDRKVG